MRKKNKVRTKKTITKTKSLKTKGAKRRVKPVKPKGVKRPKHSISELRKKKVHKKTGKTKPAVPPSKEIYNGVRQTKIRVIGIGGGGSSIVSEVARDLKKVDFVVANTDLQALKESAKECRKFNFGQTLTHGLGCGMNPNLGSAAAEAEKGRITKLFQGIDLCIFVASLGGGTGSGAAPVFAELSSGIYPVRLAKPLSNEAEPELLPQEYFSGMAQSKKIPDRESGRNKLITIGFFTLPFKFEGEKKMQIAKAALKKMAANLNAFSVMPNEKIFQIINKDTPLREAFSAVNKKLAADLRGLIETIYLPGIINIDFADLRAILEEKGKMVYLNTASASGPERAKNAVSKVLENPLSNYNFSSSQRILFNIAGPKDLKMTEVEEISRTISEFNKRAKIIFGVSQLPTPEEKIKITILATGPEEEKAKKEKKPKRLKVKRKKRARKKMKKLEKEGEQKEQEKESKQIEIKKEENATSLTTEQPNVRKEKPPGKQLEPEKTVKQKEFSPAPEVKTKPKPKKTEAKEEKRTKEDKPRTFLPDTEPSAKIIGFNQDASGKIFQKVRGKPAKEKNSRGLDIDIRPPSSPNFKTLSLTSPEENLRRRSALDLRKEAEEMEKKLIAEEKKWDIPAFLRRKPAK